jgi:putative iron-dependent peroxidase
MQPAILSGVPPAARYLTFSCRTGVTAAEARDAVQALAVDEHMVVGIGEPLVSLCGGSVDGLRPFPALSGPGVEIPSSQHALWCWLHGDDQGELVNRSIEIADALSEAFRLEQVVDGFKHGDEELGKDLTGYEDGTENPTGDDAVDAAFAEDGSSFVAVQQWVHDLRGFRSHTQEEQDHIIGRRLSDNEEIEDAPESAHVKRTEQESFEPAAFVLRRSMPFAEPFAEGLTFVAFGKTLDAFEVQLRRMAGLDDGIPDALFTFSQPVNGGYYWCPPLRDGAINLDLIG